MPETERRRRKKKTVDLDFLKREIYIKYGDEVVTVRVDNDDPIGEIKQKIAEQTGVELQDQKLFYSGLKKEFENDKSLRYYGCLGGGFFHMQKREPEPDDEDTLSALSQSFANLGSNHSARGRLDRRNSELSEREMDQLFKLVIEENEEEAREARRLAELESQREAVFRLKAEADAKLKAEKEAEKARLLQEEEDRKKAEEAARLKAEQEALKKAEQEAHRKVQEQEARRIAEEKRQQQEAERLEAERKAAEEEAAKKALEEEAAKKALEEEAAKKALEEEAAKKALEEEETAKKAAEEAAAKKAAEEEAAKKAAEEASIKAAEEEAAKKAAEEEAASKAAEEEAAKKAAEEEAAKKAAEEEAASKAAEEEAASKAAEEAAAKAERKARRKSKRMSTIRRTTDDSEDYNVPFPKPHYEYDHKPTPFDMTRFRIWYMVGDGIPFEMETPVGWTVYNLKKYVVDTRKESNLVDRYLGAVMDPSELAVYPAGTSPYTFEDSPHKLPPTLEDNDLLPRDSDERTFILVVRARKVAQ